MGTRAADDRGPERRAVELAEALLREARAQQTPEERAQAGKLARMMADPHGKELTIALADQAFRSHRPERIADQLAYLLERYGVPQYMDWWERVALLLGGAMAHYLPSLVVPPIVNRLRHETQNVILPGEEEDLRRYLEERRRAGMRLNLNQLGEAILGEAEAARRLEAYLALLARDDVEYISVKVSSVFSQIDLVAFRATVARVAERLRTLYRAAARHRYRHPDGRVTPKFINLDMEEYRDLDLTVTAFREVLDEPEFLPLERGHRAPGLPARLAPRAARAHRRGRSRGGRAAARRSSCASSRARTSPWSASRPPCTAGPRRRTRRRRRWTPTTSACSSTAAGPSTRRPCTSASPATTSSTSPTASCCARPTTSSRWVEFEMLEGMANHQARAVQRARRRPPALRARSCAPRTSTAPSPIWSAGWTRTPRPRTSCATCSTSSRARRSGSPSAIDSWPRSSSRRDLSDAPRRTQDRSAEATARPGLPRLSTPRFENDPDTDWTLAAEPRVDRGRRGPAGASGRRTTIPLQIGGEFRAGARERRKAAIPRARAGVAYRYALAGPRRRRSRARPSPAPPSRRGAALPIAGARRAARGVRGRARAAARRPDRRDDPRRRQDGDRGGRRGLRGGRLRALLRPRRCVETAARARRLPHGAARRGGRDAALELPALHPRRRRARRARGRATPSSSSPRPRRCWSAGGSPRCLWDAGVPREILQFLPCPDDEIGRGARDGPARGRRRPDRLGGDRPPLPRLAARSPPVRGDERQERHHHHVARRSGPGHPRSRPLGLRPQRPEVLGGQPRHLRGRGVRRPRLPAPAPRRRGEPRGRAARGSSASRVTPLTQPPGAALRRALTVLDEGEEWLLEPRAGRGQPAALVARHQARRAARLVLPPHGVLRPRAGTHARREPRPGDRARERARRSASPAGSRRWTIARSRAGSTGIEAGNLYVNRPITGAIVGRQPFGGWKASSVGPGAKAGGPNYVLQLARWRQVVAAAPATASRCRSRWPRSSSAAWPSWRDARRARARSRRARRATRARGAITSAASTIPSAIRGERNAFRYRPCRRVIVARGADGRVALCQVAARGVRRRARP